LVSQALRLILLKIKLSKFKRFDTVGWSLELEAAYKNWVMYRLFAYGPADAIA